MAERCIVCLAAAPSVLLRPCLHRQLCTECALQLPTAVCPSCRSPCRTGRFTLRSGEERELSLGDLLRRKKHRDEEVIRSTLQVVVAGPHHIGKRRLVNKIREKFPCEQPVPGPGLGPDPGAKAGQQEGPDLLEEMDVKSTFEANAFVGGVRLCFRAFGFPPLKSVGPASMRALLGNLREMRADVLVLACSLHMLKSFQEMVVWDAKIRSFYGGRASGLPERMWILLRAPGFDPLSPSAVDFRVDIYEGLRTMNLEERPYGNYIVSPNGWLPGAVRKLAKQSAFFGARARGMDPPVDRYKGIVSIARLRKLLNPSGRGRGGRTRRWTSIRDWRQLRN